MKDRIFLIWSGDNGIARKVKDVLEKRYNYICEVGGNDRNESNMVSIGDTVIRQMTSCNQAIVLFQPKEGGDVSNNLFFELGYVLARYGMRKVHCVRRDVEKISLPSDFDNSFVEALSAKNDDEYADKIVNYFIGRQKLSVDTNKMYLINNRYIMHEMIQAHYSESGSKCSDYELAQYILFYMQAAVMFQDDGKVLDELQEFRKKHNREFSDELHRAVKISISLLEVQVGLIASEDNVYISSDSFRQYFNACKDELDEIKDDDYGIFDEWAKAILAENLAYVCSLYASNPEIDKKISNSCYKKTISYGKKGIELLDILEQKTRYSENNDHIGLVSFFRAYIYRHLFTAYKNFSYEDAIKWITASLKERRNLLYNYGGNAIDSKLFSNFEMEYYLNLMEYISFVGKENIDEFDYEMYLNDIDAYISHFSTTNPLHAYMQKLASQRKSLE